MRNVNFRWTAGCALLAISWAMSSLAGEAERYQKSCEAALAKTLPARPAEEHHQFCSCIVDESKKLGVTKREFASERERMERDPGGAAVGRIKQAANQCFDAMIRTVNEAPPKEPAADSDTKPAADSK